MFISGTSITAEMQERHCQLGTWSTTRPEPLCHQYKWITKASRQVSLVQLITIYQTNDLAAVATRKPATVVLSTLMDIGGAWICQCLLPPNLADYPGQRYGTALDMGKYNPFPITI